MFHLSTYRTDFEEDDQQEKLSSCCNFGFYDFETEGTLQGPTTGLYLEPV
jgi:hypothetical protein